MVNFWTKHQRSDSRVELFKKKLEIEHLSDFANRFLETQEHRLIIELMNSVLSLSKTKKIAKDLASKNIQLERTEMAMMNILNDAKKLEEDLIEERDRVNAVISSMGEGLIVVDKNFYIFLINNAAAKMLEVSADKAIGRKIIDLLFVYKGNQKVAEDDLPAMKMFKSGQIVKIGIEDDFYYLLPSGKKFPITLIDAPLKKGDEIIGAVVVFKDISEEKKLDEAKVNFMSVVSHQLRTPLTTIRWYAEMLNSGDAGELSESQKKFVEEVHSGVIRLNNTLNLILNLSRVEGGHLKVLPQKINLFSITNLILHGLSSLISEKNISIMINMQDKDLEVMLDPQILTQVITNLLSNSIRYTNKEGKIEISAGKQDREIIYSIKDNGIGIPENQKSRVFEKFFRADNAINKAPDGNGLGLTLVKNLVEFWEGRVWFKSQEDKGTTFYFTIPI